MFRTQKDTIRKGIQNNAGFTLIEMIVTVAIIAIFSGVVVTLIGTGSNLFRGVSGNTKSQIDAQETLNAIEDLIIDANRSVYYAYGSGTDMGEQIRSDIDDSNAASKTFITCNEYENGDGTSRYVFDVLDWVGSEGKLYYSQRQYTKASSSAEEKDENGSGENSESQPNRNESGISGENAENTDIAVAAEGDEENQTGTISGNSSDTARDSKELIARSVFAEGIENFTADVTKVESERIVRFRLTTENNGKKVKTLHTVNLRNRIQVLKPDDAFATAGSTDIRITIVGAPDSIDAGNSKILSYDASGPIDPTTVVWKITDGADKGSFPALDPTYGKLTVNNNATGTITVTVSARTADGKQTATSAPVTIQINNNRIVTGIETETKSVLVAAGYNGLNLNSEIIWKYVYSDGTKGEDNVPVSWTMDKPDNCSYAGVTSDGQISVDSEAGTSDKGSFTVRATNREHNVSNTITVKIARIDLSLPGNNATYTVGTKKELHCTYMEGGQVVETIDGNYKSDIVNITTKQKPENASDYSVGRNFAENDIGSWNVKAAVNLTERAGYDIVDVHIEKINQFSVIRSHETEGITLGKPKDSTDIVSADDNYACSPHHQYGFSISYDKSNINYIKNINWSLGGTYTGISIDPSNNNVTTIRISKTAKSGFVLHADYTGVTYQNEEISLHAEKEVKVANGIEIIPLNEDKQHAYIGESYLMQVQVKVYDANGVESKLRICDNVNKTDLSEFSIRGNLGGTAKLSSDKKNWDYYPADNTKDYGSEETATATLQRIPGVIFSNKNNALFEEPIKFILTEPSFSSNIVSSGSDSIEIGENKELYLELQNRKNESVNKDVTWDVNDGKTNLNVYTSQCGENSKVVFSADRPGTYVIKAGYHTTQNSVKYAVKTLHVRRPDVQLSIQGMNEVSKGGTASYWLQVTIDGNVKNDIEVQWSGDWVATFNHNSSKSNNTDKVEVAFSQCAESCKIKAGINYIGENFEIEKIIKIK